MTDAASEVKDTVVVEKEVEKTVELKEELAAKKTETEKNGDAVEKNGDSAEETKSQNGDDASNKAVENGDVKGNGLVETEESKDATDGVEVCGIKRKSEVGLESEDATVESSDKKQKLEDSAEPVVEANGGC
jgi:hypothetical protein